MKKQNPMNMADSLAETMQASTYGDRCRNQFKQTVGMNFSKMESSFYPAERKK